MLVTRPVVAQAVETEEGTAGGVGEEGGGGVGVLDVEGEVDECGDGRCMVRKNQIDLHICTFTDQKIYLEYLFMMSSITLFFCSCGK